MRTTRILAVLLVISASTREARAEPILVSLEAQGALPLGSPQSELLGPAARSP